MLYLFYAVMFAIIVWLLISNVLEMLNLLKRNKDVNVDSGIENSKALYGIVDIDKGISEDELKKLINSIIKQENMGIRIGLAFTSNNDTELNIACTNKFNHGVEIKVRGIDESPNEIELNIGGLSKTVMTKNLRYYVAGNNLVDIIKYTLDYVDNCEAAIDSKI
jgi:hypothetical protein